MSFSDLDPLGPFEVIVDQNAEPADWDDALAQFLLRYARKKLSASADEVSASAEADIGTNPN